jgi:hypothetical protein
MCDTAHGLMTALFTSGHVVDIVLAVMLLEVGLLLAYRHRIRNGPSVTDVLSVLVPGVFLLLALRGALVGAGIVLIAACLIAAFLAHVADVARRWN